MTFRLTLTDDEIAARWREAIGDWRRGDTSTLERTLRGEIGVPDFARAFLADVAAGIEKRPKGHPPAPRYRPLAALVRELQVQMDYEEFYQQFSVQAKLEKRRGDKSAKEKAFEAVAKKWGYKVKPGSVSHIVHKRKPK